MPIFSIVIPVYNTEKYLAECIDSIINQPFKDWELILIDDGSTDGSKGIIDNYSKKHQNVVAVHKKNEGVAIARKIGCECASGQYIIFVDSDDWIETNCLAILQSDVVKYNYPDIIKFGLIKHQSNGSVINNPVAYEGLLDREEIKRRIFPYLIQDNKARCFGTSLCGGVFKKQLITPVMITDKNAVFGEDCASLIPAIYKASTIYFEESSLYHYRYNEGSATKSRKVFPFENPYAVANHIQNSVDIGENDFKSQLSRKVVHDLFTVCISQYYRKDNLKIINKDISIHLDSEYYKEAVKLADFSGNIKATAMLKALRHRMFLLLYLYSIIR